MGRLRNSIGKLFKPQGNQLAIEQETPLETMTEALYVVILLPYVFFESTEEIFLTAQKIDATCNLPLFTAERQE